MKKIFAILLTLCLMAGVLCITAFAADEPIDDAPAAGTVLRIRAQLNDGTIVKIENGDYDDFEEGWNTAMEIANDRSDNGYDRVVVDFYSDWYAVYTGGFTNDWINGDGFDNDTIYFNDDVRMTVNLNGHTINRDLRAFRTDGEVMYVDTDADVIINNGTITGGNSWNGAGGIHVNGAKVTLNNVNVIGNIADDDDGGGIALYDGSTLIVNGGSISDNRVGGGTSKCFGGAIYASESTVILEGVEIKNNHTITESCYGAAIYADDSTVTMNECNVEGNGLDDEGNDTFPTLSILHAKDSSINIKKSRFAGNGTLNLVKQNGAGKTSFISEASAVITLKASTLNIDEDCRFIENTVYSIIRSGGSDFYISDSTFKDNKGNVLISANHSEESYFRGCVFSENKIPDENFVYTFSIDKDALTFYDCDLGTSRFDKKDLEYVRYEYSTAPESEAKIRVSALQGDDTAFSNCYKDIAYGWNSAIESAMTGGYDRVVVDLYTDWNATDGEFCNSGEGFNWDAIYFPANVKLTLNLNGHTVNRGMTTWQYNGEVMYIDSNADVIIGDGTITGGWNCNGAGGIHINGGAKVTLNNVNVKNNKTEDDDGGGIVVVGSSVLTMNGGSVSSNVAYRGEMQIQTIPMYGGGIYANDSTVILEGVTIQGNYTKSAYDDGAAIAAFDSNVVITSCNVLDNSLDQYGACSAFYLEDCNVEIAKTTFKNNGFKGYEYNTGKGNPKSVMELDSCVLTMSECIFENNPAGYLIFIYDSSFDIDSTDFTDDNAMALHAESCGSDNTVSNCKFSKGTPLANHDKTIYVDAETAVTFTDCDFGNAGNPQTGSIFGEGSLAIIVSFVSLVAAAASVWVNVSAKKKALAGGNTENAEESGATEESAE